MVVLQRTLVCGGTLDISDQLRANFMQAIGDNVTLASDSRTIRMGLVLPRMVVAPSCLITRYRYSGI
jgi:hypothetical protein